MRAWLKDSDVPIVLELDDGSLRVCDPTLGWYSQIGPAESLVTYFGLIEADAETTSVIAEEALAELN